MKYLEYYQKLKIFMASALFLLITGLLLNITAYYVAENAYVASSIIILLVWIALTWYKLLHRLHRRLMLIRYKQAKMNEEDL